jgi:hypothetical protein
MSLAPSHPRGAHPAATITSDEQGDAMPSNQLTAAYRVAFERHEQARRELRPLLEQMATEAVAEVLPGAAYLEAVGELNEDWIPTLRIKRVLTAFGEVVFDSSQGPLDRAVEDAIDTANFEYLDVLIDITGDEYMGPVTIG